jgi:hypothetical protein
MALSAVLTVSRVQTTVDVVMVHLLQVMNLLIKHGDVPALCLWCMSWMQAPGFDPEQSSTAQVLGCQSSLCNCGSPACTCFQNKCYYSRRYGELQQQQQGQTSA